LIPRNSMVLEMPKKSLGKTSSKAAGSERIS
jgi:hypothetical protein